MVILVPGVINLAPVLVDIVTFYLSDMHQ